MNSSSTQSLTPILSEEDFLPLVKEECRDLFSILSALNDDSITLNKLYYFTLLKEAEKLESFLDDHGARTNLKWLYFAELVACIRNFSLAGFQLLHILERYSDYLGRGEKDKIKQDFEKGANETLAYFSDVFRRFHEALIEEGEKRGLSMGSTPPPSTEAWRMKVTPKLPYTITSTDTSDAKERIISIAQAYRRSVKTFRQQTLHRKIKAADLSQIIPNKINETLFAEMESALHNIQSEYDTHIRGGAVERNNKWMITLRGLTAIPMHLFEMLMWLVHFYERHENQIRKNDVKGRVSHLVDNTRLLACIVDFALHFCNRYLNEGNEVAERILSEYVEPIKYELPLPQPQGFHARPATYVSLIVQEHGTDVFMIVDGKKFSCRSVLELLEAGGLLADMEARKTVFEGDKRVLDDLKILADHNYCEDQDIPTELSYLRILRNL